MSDPRFINTLQSIDEANRQDPNLDQGQPKELLYSERMSQRLAIFESDASELLQIAARGQHIERWTSARSDYPEGRTGYKQWRAELGLYHAKRVGEIMQASGYCEEDCDRAKYLVQKRGLGRDPETQCLEDVICLVFIEHYMADFAAKSGYSEDKLIDIIQKTWKKMSEKGHAAALALPLADDLKALIGKALAA